MLKYERSPAFIVHKRREGMEGLAHNGLGRAKRFDLEDVPEEKNHSLISAVTVTQQNHCTVTAQR